MLPPWTTKQLPPIRDEMAPEGSESRLLARVDRGSTSMRDLPAGRVSAAVRHRTVDEIWYVAGGSGELWRKRDGTEEVVALAAGTSVSIPRGTSFQFRNRGAATLQILITTLPPWPGVDEAEAVTGKWPVGPARPERGRGLDVTAQLHWLNTNIGEWERTGDRARLDDVLADTLDFRRANGIVVDKHGFLAALARRTYSRLDSSDVRIEVFENLAVATLIVTAAGTDDGAPFSGRYRNIRVLHAIDGVWRVVRWYNERVDAEPPPSPETTYERILGEPFSGSREGLRAYTLDYLYGQIWNRGILSDRDRRLITLSLLAMQGHQKQLEKHIRGARRAGMSKEELLEAMLHVAHYAGWAAGTSGQEAVSAELSTGKDKAESQ